MQIVNEGETVEQSTGAGSRRATRRPVIQSLVGLYARLQGWIVAVAFFLLTLSLIDPIRKGIDRYITLDTDFYVWLAASMFFVLFFLVQQVDAGVQAVNSELRRVDYRPEDTDSALQRIKTRLDSVADPAHKRLIVLGVTMYRAWPTIERWIDSGDLRDWTVRCFLVHPDYMKSQADVFDNDWVAIAASYHSQIKRRVATAQDRNRTTLEVQLYAHVPAVHGFRLGNGDVFLSFMHWNAETRQLASPNRFFEYHPGEDASPRAEEYRALFDNWVDMAATSPPAEQHQ